MNVFIEHLSMSLYLRVRMSTAFCSKRGRLFTKKIVRQYFKKQRGIGG